MNLFKELIYFYFRYTINRNEGFYIVIAVVRIPKDLEQDNITLTI